MSKQEGPPQNITPYMAAKGLAAHIEWKMSLLPDLAQRFNLGADSIASMTQHLQGELDFYRNLPPDITLREIMQNYFSKGAQFRQMLGDDED